MGVGMSFLHSVMFEMQKPVSGGESKKESLKRGVSIKTKTNANPNLGNFNHKKMKTPC